MIEGFLFYPYLNYISPMATVYQRLVAYTKQTNFKFPQIHRMYIGSEVAKVYRSQGGITECLLIVDSVEDTGTWAVPDYPNEFTATIDEIIRSYVNRLRTPKKPKITNEKPHIKSQSVAPISYSSDPASPKKTRKRIPIKKQQPEYTVKNNKGTP